NGIGPRHGAPPRNAAQFNLSNLQLMSNREKNANSKSNAPINARCIAHWVLLVREQEGVAN
ncbi:MAG: hypothetical protein OXP09_03130, partial [Gammaproteobacteria bacterium]|nr:hypothetical protein [Gammaproteobacteria bacterium]